LNEKPENMIIEGGGGVEKNLHAEKTFTFK
jgi:2-phospho-L-lactate transferase/gluconeogenesis factor (CofD/UPF0052 family)